MTLLFYDRLLNVESHLDLSVICTVVLHVLTGPFRALLCSLSRLEVRLLSVATGCAHNT